MTRHFRPTSVYRDQDCQGAELELVNRDEFRPVLTGLELPAATMKFHPDQFQVDAVMRLLGNDDAAARLKRGETGREVADSVKNDLDAFHTMREKYLLYK